MTSYEVVQEDDTDVLFGNPFEGEDLEEGLDDRGAYVFIFIFFLKNFTPHSNLFNSTPIFNLHVYSFSLSLLAHFNHSHAHYQH